MVWDKAPYSELTDVERAIIGQAKRLTVPLGNRQQMREVADLLRGLAFQIEHDCRPEADERSAMMSSAANIDCTNRKIRTSASAHGINVREGRPTNHEKAERELNKARTGETVSAAPTLHLVPRRAQ